MKKYMMSFFVASVLSLSSLSQAVLWEGVRNNTYFGVTVELTSGTYNKLQFTLPAGMMVWTTSQAQIKVQERVRGWINLNAPAYAYLDQSVRQDRQNPDNRYKRPVLYINTTGYSIVWENGEQFETNILIPQQ